MVQSLAVNGKPPWLYRQFVKEKLFTRERYWRTFSKDTARGIHPDAPCFIPDAVVWRRYLKLLISIAEKGVRLVLLESTVELMDWRNTAPSVSHNDGLVVVPESTTIQERNRLRRLVESGAVTSFCDLSIRDYEVDEFDLLEYSELSVVDRAHHGILRAGRMLLGSTKSVTIVVSDEYHELIHSNNNEAMEILSVNQLLDTLVHRGMLVANSLEGLRETKNQSEDDYERRNNIHSSEEDATRLEYLSDEQVQLGLREGSLVRGKLEVTKENPKEAFVKTSEGKFFVNGNIGHFNRSIHHDIVVLKVLPKKEWGCPIGKKQLVHVTGNDEEDADGTHDKGTPVPSAHVVAISQYARRTYVATLVDSPNADERAVIVLPMDIRIPKIRIQTKSWQRFLNQRLLVEVDSWDADSNYPNGHCVELLGPVGDLETEITCLLQEHEIRLAPFSASAMSSLPRAGANWCVPPDEVRKRRDLRTSHRIFSVDPPGCQDIDDTMHAKVLSNGDIEVGVHIADVTHFVHHNTSLDKEAQVRGTTFYLVDRRFDMLPSLLSSNLCSLHGNTDRLAVSVIWTLSPDLNNIKSCWYGRSVIHNIQAMTYDQAHNMLHDRPPDDLKSSPPPPLTAGYPVKRSNVPALKHDLEILTRLARKLRKDREEIGGAVDLSSGDLGTELKFVLDENGNPTKVSPKKELEIHHTIAELMIFANQSVAEKIFESFPESALLRVHRSVEEDRFEDLDSALQAAGIEFDGSSNMALAKSLKKAKQAGKDGAVINSLWQSLATRAMSEALYVCTGRQQDGVALSHYGLGIEKYTHFTSPIRRYADVVVHKQLLAALENESRRLQGSAPPGFEVPRMVLESLPGSTTISVLKGEGLKSAPLGVFHGGLNEDEEGDLIDSLVEGASEMVLGDTKAESTKTPSASEEQQLLLPYTGDDVARICEGLNQQNRMSKLASMECQRLFLSLYFRGRAEQTRAVVTDLRTNGLFAYIPRFDFRGAVFLSDRNRDVQIDPKFLGLPSDSGLEPTAGFAQIQSNRRFPTGACSLTETGNGSTLEVRVAESAKVLRFHVLDVVSVQISCDLSDVKARVPPPRLHLIAAGRAKQQTRESSKQTRLSSGMVQTFQEPKVAVPEKSVPTTKSLYELVEGIKIKPVLEGVPIRSRAGRPSKTECHSVVPGRKAYGNYVNPDTRTAIQEAAVAAASESAALRRAAAQASQVRQNEYDSTRRIERAVTARTQKLAAGKRNARKAKAN